jgi:magnesium-transporting ATPase (P-type)
MWQVEQVAERIENGLTVVGATAIEDKLQVSSRHR